MLMKKMWNEVVRAISSPLQDVVCVCSFRQQGD